MADHLHENVNAFMSRAARREAEQVLLERRFAVLEADEFDDLDDRLDQPPAPNERLRQLLTGEDPWDHGRRRQRA